MKQSCVRKANVAFLTGILFLIVGAGQTLLARQVTVRWKYKQQWQTLSLDIPQATYDHYKGKKRSYHYPNYLLEDQGHAFIGHLAAKLKAKAYKLKLTEWERVNYFVTFVQSFEYKTEEGEYPRYPVETVLDGGGDCEDTAILLAGLLDRTGVDCILLSPPRHMAVGVAIKGYSGKYYEHEGKRYYYIETTGKNWEIGQIPKRYTGAAVVYDLPGRTYDTNALSYAEASETIDTAPSAAPSIETLDPPKETISGTLAVAFYRSPEGEYNTYGDKKAYRFVIRVEGKQELLDQVESVQYRRMHESFREYVEEGWIRKTNARTGFRSEWKGWGYPPILVKIRLKDGRTKELTVDEKPMIASL